MKPELSRVHILKGKVSIQGLTSGHLIPHAELSASAFIEFCMHGVRISKNLKMDTGNKTLLVVFFIAIIPSPYT